MIPNIAFIFIFHMILISPLVLIQRAYKDMILVAAISYLPWIAIYVAFYSLV